MATCDSLQPVVLLTDVMESNISEIETIFIPDNEKTSDDSDWFHHQVEQTEPLNLCLNGTILNGFAAAMVKYHSNAEDSGSLDEGSDDDVIFVKQYKVSKDKTMKEVNGKKMSVKGAPRRNPVRKARVSRRFKDYTNENFEDEEFCDGSTMESGEFLEVSEQFSTKSEDCEDWKVEDVLKKNRPRKRQVNKKVTYPSRFGRKRKLNGVTKIEKKVSLKELEPLIESNLLLLKDYIAVVKELNGFENEEDGNEECKKSERTENAKQIFKQQAVLLALTKDVVDGDVLKCLLENRQ